MSNPGLGLLLALVSALTSVVSHAFLKAGEDRLAIRVWCCLIELATMLPVVLWRGALPLELWPYVAGFGVIGATYHLLLLRSYRLSDFSAAYPVARGIVPLAMAVGGALLLGDHLSLGAYAAIATIAGGILLLAAGRTMSRHGWGAALLTGLATIGYNLMTAKGIRLAQDPFDFLAWILLADGAVIPLWLLATDPGGARARLAQSWRPSWPIGLMMLLSYGTVSYAMRIAPVGPVTAIRESSVLIGLVLAAVMLKERLDARRIAAGLLIVAGAVALVFV
ncbi:MAG: EamA family transporter [Proteobacteria bacterium]|nr:EamA family transporter [Pseudomonadota bacterium]